MRSFLYPIVEALDLNILHIQRQTNSEPIQLVQITDTHLGDSPGDTMLGMDADTSLGHVIELVKSERPAIDVFLGTGDISNCGSVNSYRRFQQATDSLAGQALWLPGNHDSLAAMRVAVDAGSELCRAATVDNWQIVMLDSTIPRKVGGAFTDSELQFLRQTLADTTAEHSLICLHHHPVSIGCEWLDEQQVANADAFFSILDQFTTVRGVLWGHIHQTIDQQRNAMRLMATPSSCIQFAPDNRDFKLDSLNPGYRWLELYKDGSIKTAVSRIDYHFAIDYDHTGGY